MFFHRVWNHRVDWVGRTLKITQLKIPWLHLWPVLRDTEPNLKIRIQNTLNQVLNAARCGQQDNVSCRKVCACGPVLCVPCCWTGREIFGWLRDWFFSLVPALIRDKAQLYLAVAGSLDWALAVVQPDPGEVCAVHSHLLLCPSISLPGANVPPALPWLPTVKPQAGSCSPEQFQSFSLPVLLWFPMQPVFLPSPGIGSVKFPEQGVLCRVNKWNFCFTGGDNPITAGLMSGPGLPCMQRFLTPCW